MKFLVQYNFYLLCMLCYCIAEAQEDNSGPQLKPGVNWDYLMFTQQWPQTVCLAWKDRSTANQCLLPETVDSWTVHGIWPSNTSGNDPQFCNRTWTFNITQLLPLLTRLEKYWPNVYAGTSQDDFWEHEWSKHGTCAASDMMLDGEFEYFERGLELVLKYDLNKALDAIGIVPSPDQSYELSQIHSAISTGLGSTSSIACYKHKKTNQFLLKEIRVCLDKSLVIMNCPEEVTLNLQSDQFCPKDGLVFYPPMDYTSFPTSESIGKGEL